MGGDVLLDQRCRFYRRPSVKNGLASRTNLQSHDVRGYSRGRTHSLRSVPLWRTSRRIGGRRMVRTLVSHHGVEHISLAPCQRQHGRRLPFAFGALAVVGATGGRMAQGGKGGLIQRVLEHLVAAARGAFPPDRGPGLAGDGSQPGGGREMRGRRKVLADGRDQNPGRGPDPDPGQRSQDRAKRVGGHQCVDLGRSRHGQMHVPASSGTAQRGDGRP